MTAVFAKATVTDVDNLASITFEGPSLRRMAELIDALAWAADTYMTTIRAIVADPSMAVGALHRFGSSGRIEDVKITVEVKP